MGGIQSSGSGRARRDAAARAMQGWHSQRLLGNGEVGDPIIKVCGSINQTFCLIVGFFFVFFLVHTIVIFIFTFLFFFNHLKKNMVIMSNMHVLFRTRARFLWRSVKNILKA